MLQRKDIIRMRSRRYKQPYANRPLRAAIEAAGCFYYELANLYGVCPSTLNRWMRYRLSDEKMADLLALLRAYAEGHGLDPVEPSRAFNLMLQVEQDMAAEEG